MNIQRITRFLLKDKFQLNGSVFYYLTLFTIAIITVYPLFYTGLACGDDLASYLVTRYDKSFLNAKILAEMHGRFQYLITLPIQSIPFYWDSLLVIKLFQIVPILISLYLFYRVMKSFTESKEIAAFYVLLFLVTAQVSQHTSLFVNYPFFFSFSFSILLLSFLLLLRFHRTRKHVYLFGSALLFAFGLLFYEMYLLFFLFSAMSIIYSNFTAGNRGMVLLKKVVVQTLPFFLVVAAYMVVYIIYSRMHPTQYDGNTISDQATILKSMSGVLWGLSYTALPLTVYTHTHYLFERMSEMVDGYMNVVPYLFIRARVEWIIKAMLVFGMGYFLLLRIPKVGYATIIVGILVSAMLTFFPHLPLALTVKYIYFVTSQEMLGYVTTYYSLFGVVLFLTMVTALLLRYTGTFTILRHLLALVIAAGLVMCSFLTDFSNYYVTRDINRAFLRMNAMDELVKSDAFKAIPQNSNMYGADLWYNPSTQAGGLTVQNFEWSHYIGAKCGIPQSVFYYDSVFLFQAKQTAQPGYRFIYNQAFKTDDAMLALAELRQPGANDVLIDTVSNKVIIAFYSTDKYFTVSFKKRPSGNGEKTKIKISHINDETDPGEFVQFAIYNTKLNSRATIFTIECPEIILNSIHISNVFSRGLKIYYL